MNRIVLIFISILILCCQSQEYDFERTVVIVENQKIEILTANSVLEDFVSKKSAYANTVYPKIEEEFIKNAEFPSLLETLKSDIKPDKRLEEEIEILRNIDFAQIVESTFQGVIKELPGPDTKILFIPSNPAHKEILESYGVGLHAITPGDGKIIVLINPTIENWQELLPFALAHEYHHSVWISRNYERSDLTPLEYIILEGRADAFAWELFPETEHPFLKSLTQEEEIRIWNIIKPEMHDRDSGLNDQIMSGTSEFPTGSVYSIGYSIIEAFKKNNPQIGDRELLDMRAEQILTLSQYDK